MARSRGHTQLKNQRGGGPHFLLGRLAKGYGGMSLEAFYQTPNGKRSLEARRDRDLCRQEEADAIRVAAEKALVEGSS